MTAAQRIDLPRRTTVRGRADLDRLVDDRASDGIFRVDRRVFTEQAIFDLEMEHIFEGTWLYIGLESQIARPHDFVTTYMGRQPVLLMRDARGAIGCFYNTCRHRGAIVCPYRAGNARIHVCRYHGWTYDSAGANVGVAQVKDGQYHPAFAAENHGLKPIARLESYRGLIFGSLNPDVPSLAEHLGQTRALLDLVVDQSPQGVEYVPGAVAYTYDGNWKLQFENGLGLLPLRDDTQRVHRRAPVPPEVRRDGTPEDLRERRRRRGRRQLCVSVRARADVRGPQAGPRARPAARQRSGKARRDPRARRRDEGQMDAAPAQPDRCSPTLQIVDISAQQLRTWRPLAPEPTEIVSHCLAPIGEGDAARELRIRNYEDFFNPTGLGSSDDNLMYEYVQSGYEALNGGATLGYDRGLGAPVVPGDPFASELGVDAESWAYGPITFGDETCFHSGYREWKRLIERGMAGKLSPSA
jgi:benzoate/toluate 1,2-dioxygenase alpha subunit/2,4,5-trichlorophenoxyacetic acid oxygenase 1